ncbi:MAG: hypothetical protein R2748_04975 [Bryobacterales bacterium]
MRVGVDLGVDRVVTAEVHEERSVHHDAEDDLALQREVDAVVDARLPVLVEEHAFRVSACTDAGVDAAFLAVGRDQRVVAGAAVGKGLASMARERLEARTTASSSP